VSIDDRDFDNIGEEHTEHTPYGSASRLPIIEKEKRMGTFNSNSNESLSKSPLTKDQLVDNTSQSLKLNLKSTSDKHYNTGRNSARLNKLDSIDKQILQSPPDKAVLVDDNFFSLSENDQIDDVKDYEEDDDIPTPSHTTYQDQGIRKSDDKR
jgi:hypothetical protein